MNVSDVLKLINSYNEVNIIQKHEDLELGISYSSLFRGFSFEVPSSLLFRSVDVLAVGNFIFLIYIL